MPTLQKVQLKAIRWESQMLVDVGYQNADTLSF